jgi:uncharacterized protein YndB with AHSA1/START domain
MHSVTCSTWWLTFSDDDQGARYLLSNNWLRDRGATASTRLSVVKFTLQPTRLPRTVTHHRPGPGYRLTRRQHREHIIHDGEVSTVKIGRRRLVPGEALTEYVARLQKEA